MLATLENTRLIEAIGWSLVHFIWQGSLVAAVFALLLGALQRSSARARHALALAALATAAVCPMWTGFRQFQSANGAGAQAIVPSQGAVSRGTFIQEQQSISPSAQAPGTAPRAGDRLQAKALPLSLAMRHWLEERVHPALPYVVMVWALGVALLSLRLGEGWLQVRRLIAARTEPVAQRWVDAVGRLSEKMGVRRSVRLVRSQLVEVPTVVGWARPVVLVPALAFTSLQPHELEAILLHELAHVRRHDYLVNLVQAALETLLFFHPAVWWISACIRSTREECCDDLAAARCGSRIEYARSLATMEEIRGRSSNLALAANGGVLIQRIRRLVGAPMPPSGRSAWPAIVAVGVVAMLAVAAFPKPAAGSDDDWGSERDGLALRLTSQTLNPVVGGKVQLRLEIKNVSDRVRRHDNQTIAAFRVLRVTDPQGRSVAYSGPTYQTAGSPEEIAPGQTKVVWENVDLAEAFILPVEGEYTVSTAAANYPFRGLPGRSKTDVSDVPASNRVVLRLGPGKLPEPKATLVRLSRLAPGGWRSSLGPNSVLYVHSPTGLKKDVTTVQVWSTNSGKLDSATQARLESSGQKVEWLAAVAGHHFHLAAPAKAGELWPDHLAALRAALQSNASPAGQGLEQGAPQTRRSGSGAANSAPVAVQVLKRDGDRIERMQIAAASTGREPAIVRQRFEHLIRSDATAREAGKSARSALSGSFTDQETIVSADALGGAHDNLEVEFVDLSLPEGSKLRAEIEGESLESRKQGERTVVVGKSARIQLIDENGFVRAAVSPKYAKRDLVVDAGANRDGEISLRVFHNPGPHLAGRLAVSIDATTGMPKDEKQPPHGSVRYKLQQGDRSKNQPTRLKMQWIYDAQRLQTEAAQLPKPRSQQAIVPLPRNVKPLPHVVFGVVRDASGQPLKGVQVRAATGIGTLLGGATTSTDENGRYRLHFGKGWISAVDKVQFQVATISASKPGWSEMNLCRQGNYAMADATPPVADRNFRGVILPNQPVEIDFVMAPAAHLRGVILDAKGQPLEGMRVALTGKDKPPSSSVVAATRTDKGGRFELTDLPSGFSFQFLIEPQAAKSPWQAWASPPLAFLTSNEKTTRLRAGRSEASCELLELQLSSQEVNWRTALAQAAKKDVAWHSNEKPTAKLSAARLRLQL